MTRPFRLTPQAEDSLTEIARWTIETFGPRQADIYETELIARCRALAGGSVAGRSCAILVDGVNDLKYARAGEHFLVYLDDPDAVTIVDILHSRSDLPRHVAALAALVEVGRKG